ncbi:MAG: ROK family protein [Candidatus Rokubacteria bacterium]|nr:ROK family protein [Candidatus Rokubacteria bacterium]
MPDPSPTAPRPVGAVEAGGTKFVCAVGTGPEDLRAETVIPTTAPPETLRRVMDFFLAHGPLAAIGIGSFGPLDLDPRSPAFGSIANTPKPGWADTAVTGALAPLGLPLAIDTDVNAAALGEHRWGALRGVRTGVYVTVGTGIGGGGVVNGQVLRGLVHPEMGHVLVPHDRIRDPFPGVCPFHGDCLEGLASGVAMRERWGVPAETLPPDHPAWELEAHYLGLGLAAIVTILSPERIVVGGGVARASGLLGRVRTMLAQHLGGYVRAQAVWEAGADYVVPPALGDRAGMLGAMALALDAVTPSSSAGRT